VSRPFRSRLRFWDPQSGLLGGLIFGALILAACQLLARLAVVLFP